MSEKHYKNEISAFVNQELGKSERQTIGEHLLVCEECRREHDEIRLASILSGKLPNVDAPPSVWQGIERSLDGAEIHPIGLMPQASWFSFRKAIAFALAVVAVSALSILVYVNLFTGDTHYSAETTDQDPIETQPAVPASNVEVPLNAANSGVDANTNANTDANTSNTNQNILTPPAEGWQVETIAGAPKIGDGSSMAEIGVGQLLETDARSKAKITVADIGSVEVAPNSRVKLVGTDQKEHRLSLERGMLHAKIFVPPRLFVVDTPSGKAVDLGCEYTLEVDRIGNSILRVTGGFVALEDAGRESIVPAGMMCLTRKGKGLGTPFSFEANPEFQRALEQFDFSNKGSAALQTVLDSADFYDMITLWHLLSRVAVKDRGSVYDQLAKSVPPPEGVTRAGILDLDKKMLAAWRAEVESVWFN